MDNISENNKNSENFSGNKKRKNNYHNKNYYNKKRNFKNNKAAKKAEANDFEEELRSSLETETDGISDPNGIRVLPQSNTGRLMANEKPAAKKQYNKPNIPQFNKKNTYTKSENEQNPPREEKKFRPHTDVNHIKTVSGEPSRASADMELPGGNTRTKPPRRKHKKASDIHSVLKTYADLQENEEVLSPESISADEAVMPVEDTMSNVPAVEKAEIIGIRFKPVGKIYFFDPGDKKFNKNDAVIVETTRGVELGFVAIANRPELLSNIIQPLKTIVRAADEKDVAHFEENKIRAKDTMRIANEKIRARGLKMKLIDAEYTFDNMKLLYYFAADGRVDFRELAKDLAAVFKVRIDLRQIGVRDQPKMMGGISICGRAFCCNTFLPDFDQVTIKMAKDQNISINSAKISGACGKLMCCLKYEQEMYERESATTPKVNSIVETPDGTGVIIDTNIISGILRVSMNHSGEGRIIKNVHKSAVKVIGFLKSAESENDSSESEK